MVRVTRSLMVPRLTVVGVRRQWSLPGRQGWAYELCVGARGQSWSLTQDDKRDSPALMIHDDVNT